LSQPALQARDTSDRDEDDLALQMNKSAAWDGGTLGDTPIGPQLMGTAYIDFHKSWEGTTDTSMDMPRGSGGAATPAISFNPW